MRKTINKYWGWAFLIVRLLNSKIKGCTFFRAWYFFSAVLSGLTVSLIFKKVFNYGLPAIGQALNIGWLQESLLGSTSGAVFAAIFVLLWQGVAMPIITSRWCGHCYTRRPS